jgi:hypothetical protein
VRIHRAHPDGTEFAISPHCRSSFRQPRLVDGRAFAEWVWNRHGALGRLLLWDQARRWWLVNDPDLEVSILCARIGTFAAEDAPDEAFAWLPTLTPLATTESRTSARDTNSLRSGRHGRAGPTSHRRRLPEGARTFPLRAVVPTLRARARWEEAACG